MRKLFCSVALIAAFSGSTIAQTDTTNIDNTAIDTAAADQSNKKKRQDLFFIDLNWDYMLGMPSIVTQKYWGRGVNLGLMFDQPINKNNNFSVGIGVGFQTHNYYTDATIATYTDSTGALTSEWIVPGGIVKEKGKISLNYVDVPFELRFRTNPDKKDFRWKFAVGAKVGYLVQVHEKIIDNKGIKVKYYNYPTINKWRYGVTARVGYGSVALSGFYSLSNLFDDRTLTGPQNAFSLGITLVPF